MILDQMSTRFALPTSFLLRVARTASHRYKKYPIPKKTGGTRMIYHPARELKLIQNWLLQNVLLKLPVHAAATAYRKGSSIKRNAEMHVANNYLLRVDFQEFFPSLKGSDVIALLIANQERLTELDITEYEIHFIRQIVCRGDSLPIGAPTSPQLSNAIMLDFDETWWRRAHDLEVTYTRYADDLYFSTNRPNILRDLLNDLRESLRGRRSPTLVINDRKTAFSSRKRRRLAAGLVLTSDRKISVGRKRKRILKSLVMKLKLKTLEPSEIAHLRGWISYLHSIEPDFVHALERKYKLDLNANPTWEI